MVYALIPDEFPRIARDLSSDAVRLFIEVLAYERDDPQPGEHHLTVLTADLRRASFLSSDTQSAAQDELLAAGWWRFAPAGRMYIGGPTVVAELHWTREKIDAKKKSARDRQARARAAKSSDGAQGSAPPTQPNPTQEKSVTSRVTSRVTGRGNGHHPGAIPAAAPAPGAW